MAIVLVYVLKPHHVNVVWSLNLVESWWTLAYIIEYVVLLNSWPIKMVVGCIFWTLKFIYVIS